MVPVSCIIQQCLLHHHGIMCCHRWSGTWKAPTIAGPTRPPLPPLTAPAPGRAACAGISCTHPCLLQSVSCTGFDVLLMVDFIHARCNQTGTFLILTTPPSLTPLPNNRCNSQHARGMSCQLLSFCSWQICSSQASYSQIRSRAVKYHSLKGVSLHENQNPHI